MGYFISFPASCAELPFFVDSNLRRFSKYPKRTCGKWPRRFTCALVLLWIILWPYGVSWPVLNKILFDAIYAGQIGLGTVSFLGVGVWFYPETYGKKGFVTMIVGRSWEIHRCVWKADHKQVSNSSKICWILVLLQAYKKCWSQIMVSFGLLERVVGVFCWILLASFEDTGYKLISSKAYTFKYPKWAGSWFEYVWSFFHLLQIRRSSATCKHVDRLDMSQRFLASLFG